MHIWLQNMLFITYKNIIKQPIAVKLIMVPIQLIGNVNRIINILYKIRGSGRLPLIFTPMGQVLYYCLLISY